MSGSWDEMVKTWGAVTGEVLKEPEGGSKWFILSKVNSVTFSPGGKQVVLGSEDRTVRLRDVFTGAALQKLEGHSS